MLFSSNEKLRFDFGNDKGNVKTWFTITDNVMGGVSTSKLSVKGNSLLFTGPWGSGSNQKIRNLPSHSITAEIGGNPITNMNFNLNNPATGKRSASTLRTFTKKLSGAKAATKLIKVSWKIFVRLASLPMTKKRGLLVLRLIILSFLSNKKPDSCRAFQTIILIHFIDGMKDFLQDYPLLLVTYVLA